MFGLQGSHRHRSSMLLRFASLAGPVLVAVYMSETSCLCTLHPVVQPKLFAKAPETFRRQVHGVFV